MSTSTLGLLLPRFRNHHGKGGRKVMNQRQCMTRTEQSFLNITGQVHIWTDSDYECVHKTCTRGSWKKSQNWCTEIAKKLYPYLSSQAGLRLTWLHLPVPPECWNKRPLPPCWYLTSIQIFLCCYSTTSFSSPYKLWALLLSCFMININQDNNF